MNAIIVPFHYNQEYKSRRHKLLLDFFLLQTERWARLQQSVQALSPREQHIIALKFGSELTNRAIAPIIGTSENNVAVILYRTMRKLRAYLEREQGSVSTPERSISYG